VAYVIVHLNDAHRWSRSRTADWVSMVPNRTGPTLPHVYYALRRTECQLFAGSRHPHFRAALIVLVPLVLIIVIVFAVAFVFLFVVWLLSKEDTGSYRPIERVCVGAF